MCSATFNLNYITSFWFNIRRICNINNIKKWIVYFSQYHGLSSPKLSSLSASGTSFTLILRIITFFDIFCVLVCFICFISPNEIFLYMLLAMLGFFFSRCIRCVSYLMCASCAFAKFIIPLIFLFCCCVFADLRTGAELPRR